MVVVHYLFYYINHLIYQYKKEVKKMSRGSVELTNTRKNEIIEACSKLYKEKNYNEITIKDIAHATTLTRTAIYKYYQTKEEIFLNLLKREYDNWNHELLDIIQNHETLTKKEIAHLI